MAFPCPRCGDRYTQSLPMVYGTSTHVRSWRSGSGYWGTTTSRSLVGAQAAPPEKSSVWRPILLLLMLWGLLLVGREFVQGEAADAARQPPAVVTIGRQPAQRTPHAGVQRLAPRHEAVWTEEQWEQAGAWLLVGWGVCTGLLVWRLVRAIRFNRWIYPVQVRRWNESFLCRGCGMVFAAPDSYAAALLER